MAHTIVFQSGFWYTLFEKCQKFKDFFVEQHKMWSKWWDNRVFETTICENWVISKKNWDGRQCFFFSRINNTYKERSDCEAEQNAIELAFNGSPPIPHVGTFEILYPFCMPNDWGTWCLNFSLSAKL
jgi:hypothetical protein